MDVLLQRLVKAPPDDEDLVPGHRAPEVAALHVWDGAQVAPSPDRGQEVGDVVRNAVVAESSNLKEEERLKHVMKPSLYFSLKLP